VIPVTRVFTRDQKPWGSTSYVAMLSGLRRKLNPFIQPDFVAERIQKMKASVRTEVEHRSAC
jgi:hypothetical protein